MNFEISVVMSVYKNDNCYHFKEAVDSLLAQTLLPSEIIIVVDGSVDENIKTLLFDFSKIDIFKIIYLENNKGLANALNIGVNASSFNIIARMDSDDICLPDRLQKQMKFLINNDLDIVGGQILEFGANINDVISERKVPLDHTEIVKFLKTRSPFSHPTIIFHKKVFKIINGYDVNVFPEDYDFFVRAFLNNFKFGNVKETVLFFRVGSDKKSALKRRHGYRYAKNEFKLYKKFYKLKFYNLFDFLKVVLGKIPLRLLPFSIFSLLYYNLFRNKKNSFIS